MPREEVDYPPNCQPIPTSSTVHELIKRLKLLSESLHDTSPNVECGKPTRYLKLFHHLSHEAFLSNKNPDVQIYLACCLANILRIFSPEIPATEPKLLKDQYHFVLRVLKGLGDTKTESPMFKRYHYLLELMHAAKLMHAVTEMGDDATALYRSFLKSVLYVPTGKGWKKSSAASSTTSRERRGSESGDSIAAGSVESGEEEDKDVYEKIKEMLVDLACRTIHEMDQVSNSALDVIFFYLIKPQKIHCVESSEMALVILKKSKLHVEPTIHAVLEQAMMAGELPSDFEMTGSGSRVKLFEIIRELHDISHDLVSTVLPFLPQMLQSDDEDQREHTTRLVGMMARSSKSQFGEDPDDATWNSFLMRFRDSSEKIRVECAQRSQEILLNHSQLRGQVSSHLDRLLHDQEETVRMAAIQVVTDTAKQRLEAISEHLVTACCVRMIDKKPKVRAEAIKRLLHLFHQVITDTNNKYSQSDRDAMFVIPQKTLSVYHSTYRTGYKDTMLMIERYFQLYVVPYKMEFKSRMKLMAELYRRLETSGLQAFTDIVARSAYLRRNLQELLQNVSNVEMDHDTKAKNLQDLLKKISAHFPDAHLLLGALKLFTNQISTDQRSFELLQYIVSNNYTTEKMEATAGDLLARLLELKTVPSVSTGSGQVLRRFIDRCTPLSMDNQSAQEFTRLVLDMVKDAQCLHSESVEIMPRYVKLLGVWVEHFPHLFSSDEVIDMLRKMIVSDEYLAVEAGLDSLHTICRRMRNVRDSRWYKPLCNEVLEVIESEQECFGRACKLAVRVACYLLGREKCMPIFDEMIKKLLNNISLSNIACVNAFQALSQMHRAFPKRYFKTMMEIVNDRAKLGREFILSTEIHSDDPIDFDPTIPIERQPWPKYTGAKIYAIKFATRVLCQAVTDSDVTSDPDLMTQLQNTVEIIFCALANIIRLGGDVSEMNVQCSVERARLRAVAGSSCIHLCYFWPFRKVFDVESFICLSKLVLDDADCVRNYFVLRLRKGLQRKLAIEFSSYFSCAHWATSSSINDEQNAKDVALFKESCKKLAVTAFSMRRASEAVGVVEDLQRPLFDAEYAVAYTVYLLAHHEGLASNEDVRGLADVQEGLWFVLDGLVQAKCNLQTIVQILEELKKDGDNWMKSRTSAKSSESRISQSQLEEHNKKIWAICDLGIAMMLYRAKLVVKDDDQKKPHLSRNFFYRVPGANPAECYAPDELIEDEKRRNGRLPTNVNNFSTTKRPNSTSLSSGDRTTKTNRRGGRGGGRTQRKKREMEEASMLIEDSDDDVIRSDDEEVIPAPKKRSTKESINIADSDSDDEGKTTTSPKRASARGKKNSGEKEETVKPTSPSKGAKKTNRTTVQPKSRSPKKKAVASDDEDEQEETDEVPSTSAAEEEPNSSRRRGASNKKTSAVMQNGNTPTRKGRASQAAETAMDELHVSTRFGSLEDLTISPIVKDGKPGRRAVKAAKLSSSTPLVDTKKGRPSLLGAKRKSENGHKSDESNGAPLHKRKTPRRQSLGGPSKSAASPTNSPKSSRTKNVKKEPVETNSKPTTRSTRSRK